jgi:hypothetical protein
MAALSASALVFIGLVPALLVMRGDVNGLLYGQARVEPHGRRWSRPVLGALQCGVAGAVLFVMALLAGSYANLAGSVQGIDVEGLASASIEWTAGKEPSDALSVVRQIVERAQEPGAQRFGLAMGIPGLTLPGGLWTAGATVDSPPVATAFPVDRTTLDMFRLQLIAGRWPTEAELNSDAPVALLDEQAVRRLGLADSSIGTDVDDRRGPATSTRREVIGIVREINVTPGGERTTGVAFVPLPRTTPRSPSLLRRGAPTSAEIAALERAVRAIDPGASVSVRTLSVFERRLGEPRLLARLTTLLGLMALALTVSGVFAIASQGVAGRWKELGVRLALGASASSVRRLVLTGALLPAAAGLAAGVALAAVWSRQLQSLLYGIDPRDWRVYAGVAAVVVLTTALAAAVPARRASRIDPIKALRGE